MAVINPYSAAVASIFAENAVATRQDKRLIRDAELTRQISDVEKRMALEQIASSQKQAELTVNIAQKSASAVQNGIQAGQKIADAGDHIRINSDLQSGAAQYRQGHTEALLNTDLGNGQTVRDSLGDNAEAKLDALMSGNFNSVEDLERIGFSGEEARALMGLKERGAGNELTTDEAVEFLFNRSPIVQQDGARDRIHKAADMLIKDVLFSGSQSAAKIGQQSAKTAAKQLEEDSGDSRRNRGTQSRMSWLATEQMNDASKMVLNKKDQTYKP